MVKGTLSPTTTVLPQLLRTWLHLRWDTRQRPDLCTSDKLPGRGRDDLLQMTSALGQRLQERRQPPREDVPGGPFLLLFLLLPGSLPSLHIKAAPPPRPLSLLAPLRRALSEWAEGEAARSARRRRDAGGGAETAPSVIILSPAAVERSGRSQALRRGIAGRQDGDRGGGSHRA